MYNFFLSSLRIVLVLNNLCIGLQSSAAPQERAAIRTPSPEGHLVVPSAMKKGLKPRRSMLKDSAGVLVKGGTTEKIIPRTRVGLEVYPNDPYSRVHHGNIKKGFTDSELAQRLIKRHDANDGGDLGPARNQYKEILAQVDAAIRAEERLSIQRSLVKEINQDAIKIVCRLFNINMPENLGLLESLFSQAALVITNNVKGLSNADRYRINQFVMSMQSLGLDFASPIADRDYDRFHAYISKSFIAALFLFLNIPDSQQSLLIRDGVAQTLSWMSTLRLGEDDKERFSDVIRFAGDFLIKYAAAQS